MSLTYRARPAVEWPSHPQHRRPHPNPDRWCFYGCKLVVIILTMHSSVDVLLLTAAEGEGEGEDEAVRLVDDGALGPWGETPGPLGYGFPIWVGDVLREDIKPRQGRKKLRLDAVLLAREYRLRPIRGLEPPPKSSAGSQALDAPSVWSSTRLPPW